MKTLIVKKYPNQSGMVLLITMIMLLILSILGIDTMTTSTTQLNMINGFNNMSDAFADTENIIVDAEKKARTMVHNNTI